MRNSLGWILALSMAAFAWSAVPAAKKAPAKKSTSAAKKSTGKASARNSKASKKPAVSWRNRQTTPGSDRYKEIQGALAAKGYLPKENATGAWDQASIDGLKRFQADQKIDTTGKINSLSLIALGLGPRRDNVPSAAPPVAAAPAPPEE